MIKSSDYFQTKMAQKGLKRILSRKDGKSMVSNDKDNEKVKLTKVLELVPARKPEQAKLVGGSALHV